MSLRDSLHGLLARARTDQRKAELEAELALPRFPEAVRYLWQAFWDIRVRRAGNGFQTVPISWGDIDAYVRLTGSRFAPWEVRLITALDDAWLGTAQDQNKSGQSDE